MLIKLVIQNIAIIDNVSIEFNPGLNILTGETGAGKSIIIDAINSILGERTSKELIRNGTDKAFIEAEFYIKTNEPLHQLLNEFGIDAEEDGTIILQREFTSNGKNSCRINGRMVTVSVLKQIGQILVDIHGQHDNQSLLRTESHIELLDSFAGKEISDTLLIYNSLLSNYREIKKKLSELNSDPAERERKVDILKFQADEIRSSNLKLKEDEELEKERLILSNSEKIISVLTNSYESLFEGNKNQLSCNDTINNIIRNFSSIINIDEKYNEIYSKIKELSYHMEEISDELRKTKENMEYSPENLELIYERIDLITRLKRKYGKTIADILSYYEKIEKELSDIINSEEIISKLNLELKEIENKLTSVCKILHEKRQNISKIIEDKICSELNELEIKNSTFKVNLEYDVESDNKNYKFNKYGYDKVEFLISTNVGEPLKPLAKIASGGEMSRIMLAIKTILAGIDNVPTMIFDEIDSGISGRAAQKVGIKLSELSRDHQIICITHLPQIASMADNHYLIEKTFDNGTTRTNVHPLRGESLVSEIARIIGGENISDITREHAIEMLHNSSKIKQK